MKKIVLTIAMLGYVLWANSTTYTITNNSYTFSPSTITISQGDQINFVLASIHNALEVSQSTWDANGNSPLAGGFTVPYGGGLVSASALTVGTHYYVCEPHAVIGMKGTIIVTSASGVVTTKYGPELSIYINAGTDALTVELQSTSSQITEIKLFDIAGSLVSVLFKNNIAEGSFSKTFDLSGKVQAGIYFVQISTGAKNYIRKIVMR
ncbi:T9SS type A sorting domain-containing protein [Parabacteroides sp. FAFU027]|uniref:T9SS type A sorting domain-containing protein n=1 Tax=Parabacteroides sp. FAFU027 TaxID=2922715 RepID=UPI001FAEC712|nr:T9SS type A sorting domain-containing protein [Parabacteroides sp. FAFU027]